MIPNPYPSHPHFTGLVDSLKAGDRQVQYLEGLEVYVEEYQE